MLRYFRICVGSVLSLAIFTADARGQDQRLVGQFSDLSRSEIRGVRTYTAEHVREELCKDAEAILAAHPLALLEDLPTAISQRLLAGFQHAGFANADVRTEIDLDNTRLIATVTEASRFLSGSIRIENTKQVDGDQLKQRLTEPFPPREAVTPVFDETATGRVAHWLDKDGKKVDWAEPVWATGKPARCDESSQSVYQRQVDHALEDLGFRDATFDVSLVPNHDTRRVDIAVMLRDEGLPAKLGRIEIHGNYRDSAAAILDYANLSVGTLMNSRRETQLRYDLWRSGRFISHEIKLSEPLDDGGYTLVLDVKESPYAPPIDQPLTKEEETLLKMGRWLANTDAWPSDMMFSTRSETSELTAAIAPRDGLAVTLRPPPTDSEWPITLVGSRHELACYPSRSNIHLQAPMPAGVLESSLIWQLNDRPDEPNKPFSIGFDVKVKSRNEGDAVSPIRMKFQATPAACLAIAHARNATTTWQGDRLIVDSDKDHFEIDGRNGRLFRFAGSSPEDSIEIQFADDAFATALKSAHDSAADGENVFDANRPLRSTFDFLFREPMLPRWATLARILTENEWPQTEFDELGAWSRFLTMGVLDPIDEYLTNRVPNDDMIDSFEIPTAHPDTPATWIQSFAFSTVPLSDDLFPRDSWPWTVWRETGFVVAGRGHYTRQQLLRIYESKDFGPVAILIVARLLDGTNQPAAQAIAGVGTRRMSSDDFRKDYLPLLDDTRIAGKCIRRAGEIVRALNDSEQQELLTHVPDKWNLAFAVFSSRLRSETNGPIDEALAAALDVAWEAGLRTVIDQELIEIRDRGGLRLSSR